MAESSEHGGLKQKLAAARSEMKESLARQAKMSRTNAILTWSIVIVVIGFIWAGWHRLQLNFSPENVQQSLVKHGPEAATRIFDAVSATATEVIPVYYELGQAKMVEKMPEAAMAVDKEIQGLGDAVSEKVSKQIEDSLNNVKATQEKAFKQAFPDLTEEQGQKIIDAFIKSGTEQLEGLTGDILSVTVGDIANLDKTIKTFETGDLPSDEAELSRLMMHHLLLYFDAEIMDAKLETPKADAKGGK